MTNQPKAGIGATTFKILACFSLPVIILAYYIWENNTSNAGIAVSEIAGDAYQTPLEKLLRDIMDHQRLTHHCPNNGNCKADLQALQASIDQEIKDLHAMDKQYGTLLEFTGTGLAKRGRQLDTVENLDNGWHALLSDLETVHGKPADAMDAKYDDLVNIVHVMTQHLGDTSQLILDPDLNTYHFMVDLLLTLPQNQDRIERMIASARQAYEHGTPFNQKDRMALAQQAGLLQTADIDQLKLDTNTALKEDSNNSYHPAVSSFQSKVPPAMQAFVDANEALVDATNKMASEGRPPYTLDQYVAIALKARQASFDFWFMGAPEEDNELRLRGDWYSNRANRSIAVSGGAAVLASVGAAFIL